VSVPASRLTALAAFDREWIDHLKHEIDLLKSERSLLLRLLLTGGDTTILGSPAHIETAVTWPEGLPRGFTMDEIVRIMP
jgi:hypothetical protein